MTRETTRAAQKVADRLEGKTAVKPTDEAPDEEVEETEETERTEIEREDGPDETVETTERRTETEKN